MEPLPSPAAPMRIAELIARRAAATPDAPFWEEPGSRLTYLDLHREANRVARALEAERLAPGAHIAICADNGVRYVLAHYGAARAGLVLAHLNARSTAAEMAPLLVHSGARLLFFATRQAAAVAEAVHTLEDPPLLVQLPDGTTGGSMDSMGSTAGGASAVPGAQAWAPWLAPHGDADIAADSAAELEYPPESNDESPFQLLYTSGTTGTPKGALISHRAKLRQGTTHALNLGLRAGDRVWSALPLYHQYAQWLLLASVPIAGATVVARDAFDAQRCWADLAAEHITHLPLVPTMLYRLLDVEGILAPPSLRCIVYGGAPIDAGRIPEVRARFPGVQLFQGFGQTETGYCLGLHDGEHEPHPASVGIADPFSEVRLLDSAGEPVPDGQVGEIVARTPYLMNGYHNDPEATAEYFAYGADWGRTGDLGIRDAEGFVTLAGRTRELVISGGVNLYPAEIERVLLTGPGVADAAVFGIPDAEWGETLVAAVVADPDADLAVDVLKEHCRRHLAPQKCPRVFHIVDSLPRTVSGKVQKHRLREAFSGGPV